MKESDGLVVIATEFAEVEAKKLKEELAITSHLLFEARKDLLEWKALAKKHWEEELLEQKQLAEKHKISLPKSARRKGRKSWRSSMLDSPIVMRWSWKTRTRSSRPSRMPSASRLSRPSRMPTVRLRSWCLYLGPDLVSLPQARLL